MENIIVPRRPRFIRKWWVSIRPFSLPASTMPVLFGSVLAVTVGGSSFKLIRFVAALVGMILLHAAANLLNDVYDLKKGLDRQVIPVSGGVVRGWITSRQALIAAWSFIAVGSFIGVWMAIVVGWPIFWLGVAGIIIGVGYSWGPLALKYRALGDLAVFLNFGILGSLGSWTVQTGTISWIPTIWSVPIAMLVIGIVHGNNWRDIASDKLGNISTVAGLLGDNLSLDYYALLVFGPFVFVFLYILLSWGVSLKAGMPWTASLVVLALPPAVILFRKGKNRHVSENPLDFVTLDGATAQLSLIFGLLYTIGLGIGPFFR